MFQKLGYSYKKLWIIDLTWSEKAKFVMPFCNSGNDWKYVLKQRNQIIKIFKKWNGKWLNQNIQKYFVIRN